LLEHFELSFEAGIGGFLFREGRILRRDSEETLADVEVQREFELLGAQVAIPILDRETVIGVAAFDGRVTGEPLVNGELELIFHLLEEMGLAIKNIWLHDQLAANHGMMADILRELSSACVVVSRDLAVLHANKMARRYFARPGQRNADLEFSDLPQTLGSKVYQVLRTGTGLAPFRFEPADSPGVVYQATIVPFQTNNTALPNSVLLMVEDRTQSEQLQHLEIEAANLRLVKTMADRLAHEIGNALVPLSTHQQLLADKYRDPEFRASLDIALADGVKRISRLTSQMRYLARDSVLSKEAFPLAALIDEAYQEAQKYQQVKAPKPKVEGTSQPVILAGDRAALKHAFAEIILNAFQANPADAKVGIQTQTDISGAAPHWLHLEIRDNGGGFTPDSAKKALDPFFTTRNVGLGLGLTVANRIIETHHGKLVVLPPHNGDHGLVRVSLPLETPGNG
jgi:signal transduction histidine kinase